jgi:hypothetical protein
MTPFVIPEERGLAELFTALETLKGLVLIVASQVLDHQLFVLEGSIALVTNILASIVGKDGSFDIFQTFVFSLDLCE